MELRNWFYRMTSAGPADTVVAALKSAAEPTRLRILLLLEQGELTVKDLTSILGQSQPRISRHLRLLHEAGLIERFREGSWVYLRLSEGFLAQRLGAFMHDVIDGDDPLLARDRLRAQAVKRDRASLAQAYFNAYAADWDEIRALHVAENDVEAAMRAALGGGPFDLLVDLGTGTGRVLELFADNARRAVGIDVNQAMLAYARTSLDRPEMAHCQVRHGDLLNLSLPDGEASAVVLHQVLHYLHDPQQALTEAARIVAPDGRLLVVDFAAHQLEFLREVHAHQRLGFSEEQMSQWMARAGLELLSVQHLKPGRADKTEKLTVSVWLAMPSARRGRSSDKATDRKQEERA